MVIKLKHSNTYSTYFITFTCVEWILLIEWPLLMTWIINARPTCHPGGVWSLKWIPCLHHLPNHLHVILHFHSEGFHLYKIIANGKRFIAYEIVNRLEIVENTTMLDRLKSLVTEREKKKGQLHKIFKGSFDAKAIFTQPFLL